MEEWKKILILYSGGADSRLLLEIAITLGKNIRCLLVDYGQIHIKELEVAKKHLDSIHIPYDHVTIQGLNINSALTGNKIKGQYTGVSEFNIPGRNSMLLSLAFSIAESNDIKEIWYGPDMTDYYNSFPDCYQTYVGKVNELFEIAGSKKISVIAPLLGLSKEMVLELLEKGFKVNKDEIFSGYGEGVN